MATKKGIKLPKNNVVIDIERARAHTTDLRALENGALFTWGEMIGIHHVGLYAIVVYRDYDDELKFHPYVGEYDTHHSYPTLEAALVGAIALRHDGANTQADRLFMRGISADEHVDGGEWDWIAKLDR